MTGYLIGLMVGFICFFLPVAFVLQKIQDRVQRKAAHMPPAAPPMEGVLEMTEKGTAEARFYKVTFRPDAGEGRHRTATG